MKTIEETVRNFQNSHWFKDFRRSEPSDTRLLHVTLYDHFTLTAGIAVAMTKELLIRGKTPEQICGEDIKEAVLLTLARFAPLLQEVVKTKSEGVDFLETSRKILDEHEFKEPFFSLILDTVAHFRLQDPKTLLHKIIGLADALASADMGDELAGAEGFHELYNQIFEGEKGLAVILGDVDRVHSYVFGTSKLPEIRGASEILNFLNFDCLGKIFENKLAKECLIYHGGGSFLAVAPASLSDSIIERIEKAYLDETGIATITCVKKEVDYLQFVRGLVPYANEDIKNIEAEGIGNWLIESYFGEMPSLEKKGFGDIVASLSVELRWKKDMKEKIPFFVALPIGRRCSSCGKRVAVCYDSDEERWLCNVCKIKREKGVEMRLRFRMAFKKAPFGCKSIVSYG
jgi:hypothetical protein